MEKVIYFPTQYDVGLKYGYPVVMHIVKKWFDDTFQAILEEDGIKTSSLFHLSRTLPYSDELYNKCILHIEKRKEVEEEYNNFLKECKKSNNKRKKK